MDLFVRKHQKKINGTLGCFDRMLFRGYLPIQSGWQMAQFLNQNQITFRRLKDFLVSNADRIKEYARTMAAKQAEDSRGVAISSSRQTSLPERSTAPAPILLWPTLSITLTRSDTLILVALTSRRFQWRGRGAGQSRGWIAHPRSG